jgi:DNA-binding NtrC family response regulator
LAVHPRLLYFSVLTVEKSPRRYVLIVDDEALIRWSMAETLSQGGYDVAEASNAKEALQRLADPRAPDAILLDFRLPDSNDLKLLETIRGLVPNSPVIMMTAFGSPEVLSGALALGASRVLNKPVDLRDLIPLVEQVSTHRAAKH